MNNPQHISAILPAALATLLAAVDHQRPASRVYHGERPCLPPEAWAKLSRYLRRENVGPLVRLRA